MKVRFPLQLKTKSRRFGLRTLFLAITASAVFFAILGPKFRRHFVDRRWQSVGAKVWYYHTGKATGLVLQPGHQLESEDWAEMNDVFYLWFQRNVTADEWRRLEKLPNLISLELGGAAIGDADLAKLRGLPHLSNLVLDETSITNAGLTHLVGLSIEHLELEGTAISDAGIPILEQMHDLQELWLTSSKVSDDGLKTLQERLPNCEIIGSGWRPEPRSRFGLRELFLITPIVAAVAGGFAVMWKLARNRS